VTSTCPQRYRICAVYCTRYSTRYSVPISTISFHGAVKTATCQQPVMLSTFTDNSGLRDSNPGCHYMPCGSYNDIRYRRAAYQVPGTVASFSFRAWQLLYSPESVSSLSLFSYCLCVVFGSQRFRRNGAQRLHFACMQQLSAVASFEYHPESQLTLLATRSCLDCAADPSLLVAEACNESPFNSPACWQR